MSFTKYAEVTDLQELTCLLAVKVFGYDEMWIERHKDTSSLPEYFEAKKDELFQKQIDNRISLTAMQRWNGNEYEDSQYWSADYNVGGETYISDTDADPFVAIARVLLGLADEGYLQ